MKRINIYVTITLYKQNYVMRFGRILNNKKGGKMNDFNSRYRNIDDQPDTIRTNAGTFEYSGFANNDMDIMEAENAQKKKQVARASQARGGSSRRRKSRRTMIIYGIIIAIEVVALAVIWTLYFTYEKSGSKASTSTESSSEESSSNGNINVDNDNFALTCTKMSITADASGNPVAVVYFTFVNKTDAPLSMSQVFAPSFMQAGANLTTNGVLAEETQEITNKDVQVANGESIVCGYVVPLADTTSEITITMHDNYETFSDIGSTVVAIN